MQTAICPGSFDPITLGHLDVIRRASQMFERVVVCVVANPGKHCAITLEERCEQVRRVTASIPNVEVDMWCFWRRTKDTCISPRPPCARSQATAAIFPALSPQRSSTT